MVYWLRARFKDGIDRISRYLRKKGGGRWEDDNDTENVVTFVAPVATEQLVLQTDYRTVAPGRPSPQDERNTMDKRATPKGFRTCRQPNVGEGSLLSVVRGMDTCMHVPSD